MLLLFILENADLLFRKLEIIAEFCSTCVARVGYPTKRVHCTTAPSSPGIGYGGNHHPPAIPVPYFNKFRGSHALIHGHLTRSLPSGGRHPETTGVHRRTSQLFVLLLIR